MAPIRGLGPRLARALEELWIAIFGWIPGPPGMALRLLAWRWLFAACGSARFATGLCIECAGRMRLGDGVRLGRGCVLTARGGRLEIGDFSALSPYAQIGADSGRVSIGRRVAIGPGSVLRAANHCFERVDLPIMSQGHRPGSIVIGDDVWIGANCVITPDVRIGEGAVIGAGAVVTRDVEPFSVAAGVPARKIGERGKGAA